MRSSRTRRRAIAKPKLRRPAPGRRSGSGRPRMPEAPLPPDLPGSLDAVHVAVREAFQRRDLAAYLEDFAPDLRYRGADGPVPTPEELGGAVRGQLERLAAFPRSFGREA